MKHRLVLFDLDDTLMVSVESKWAHHRAVARTFYGLDLSETDLRRHWGKPFELLIAELYRNADSPEAMRNAYASLNQDYLKRAFHDAAHTLEALLANSVEVGIVTSAEREHVNADLALIGISESRLFCVQAANDSSVHKPDPGVFDAVLVRAEALGFSRSQVAYIGDSIIDYCAARDAGIDFIGVTTGLFTADEFRRAGADMVVASLAAVIDVLGIPAL